MKKVIETTKNKQLLLRVLDDSPFGVAVWQWRSKEPSAEHLFLLYANKMADRVSNFPLSEHIGHSIQDTFPGFSDSEHIAMYFDSLQRQVVNSYELNGTEKFTSMSFYRLDLRPIDKSHLLVACEDITEMKLLAGAFESKASEIAKKEYEINLVRRLSEYSSDAIFIVDVETGRFLDWNKTAMEKTGYTKNELINLSLVDLDEKVFSIEQWRAIVALARKKSVVDVDSCMACKTGECLPVDISFRFVAVDSEEFMITSIRDARERKRYQETIEKAQADTAHILRVATINEFASEIAHELNQPLAAIVGYVQGISKRIQNGWENINQFSKYIDESIPEIYRATCHAFLGNGYQNVEQLMKTAKEIEEQALRSSKVIERVRDFARKSDLSIEMVDIRESIALAVELTRPLAKRFGITFNLRLGAKACYVLADKIHIEQVLVNLIKNAIESMIEVADGKREVLIQLLPVSNSTVEVIIRDFGRGFDMAEVELLFTNYYSTKHEGLGVGLSISRKLVEANGGRLTFIGKKNDGACMQVLLKAASDPVFDCEGCILKLECELPM